MTALALSAWIMIVASIFITPLPDLYADVPGRKDAVANEQEAASNADRELRDPTETDLDRQIEVKLITIIETLQDDAAVSPYKDTHTDTTEPESKDKKREESEPRPPAQPVYRPPIRGAPVGRVAGGTRGIFDEHPALLCVISPDHTALTLRSQPQLYWYLRETTSYPVELTIIEDRAIYPLLETEIHGPIQPGIGTIELADYDVRLREGVTYKWFVAVVPDPDHRSKDILAWGAVRYVNIPDELTERISRFGKETAIDIYVRAGIWYDAFAAVSDLIHAAPEDLNLRGKRKALLEQIGLARILP